MGVRKGAWVCQTCQRPTILPIDEENAPTCGQRGHLYCPRCEASQTFQFWEVLRDDAHERWLLDRQRAFDTPPEVQRHVPLGTEVVFVEAPTAVVVGEVVSAGAPELLPAVRSPAVQEQLCSERPYGGRDLLPLYVGGPALDQYLADHYSTDEGLAELRSALVATLARVDQARHERTLCIICLERPKTVIALPCRHRCMCQPCYERVVALAANPECPLCRGPLRDTIIPFD